MHSLQNHGLQRWGGGSHTWCHYRRNSEHPLDLLNLSSARNSRPAVLLSPRCYNTIHIKPLVFWVLGTKHVRSSCVRSVCYWDPWSRQDVTQAWSGMWEHVQPVCHPQVPRLRLGMEATGHWVRATMLGPSSQRSLGQSQQSKWVLKSPDTLLRAGPGELHPAGPRQSLRW